MTIRAKLSIKKPLFVPVKARKYLELIPCPLVFWGVDNRFCAMNQYAGELTGYTAEEFQNESSLWTERIHPDDRDVYLNARIQLRNGAGSSSCEYRFLPKGQTKQKWLNEASLAFRFSGKEGPGVISAYRDVSELIDLRHGAKANDQTPRTRDVIPAFIHEMENHLQLIKGSLDLLRHEDLKTTAMSLVDSGVQRTSKLLRDLEEFVSEPPRGIVLSCPAPILRELCDRMEDELRVHNIRVNLCCRDSLPGLWTDADDFRRVVHTVIDFSRALLPRGGELRIEADLRELEGIRYMALVVSSRGAEYQSMTEESVFRPFLKINGHSIGLSMVLAKQILKRQDGKILFEKQETSPPTFTVLLPVDQNSDHAE